MRIFGENQLRDYLERKMSSVVQSIENETDDYLLNVNNGDYVEYKSTATTVESLQIHVDQIYASSSEKMIPAEYIPNSFHVYAGKSYKKDIIKFHVPFTGNAALIKCEPSSRLMWSMDVELSDKEFCFEIINFNDDVESINDSVD